MEGAPIAVGVAETFCCIPMPTPIQHLATAEEILQREDLPPVARRLLAQQRGPFLLGNTAPDVQTISGQQRSETHFYSLSDVSDHPAYETLFAVHPALARTHMLSPDRVAFYAGYIAHLLLDQLWLERIFRRHFWAGWGDRRERLFLHNVLRTWMDRQDRARLDGSVTTALYGVNPCGWLPFVRDEHLLAWRDWLVDQLGPGSAVRTAEVFAQRMGTPVADIEAMLRSPQRMKERVFVRIPPSVLVSFRDVGYEQGVEMIGQYVGGVAS